MEGRAPWETGSIGTTGHGALDMPPLSIAGQRVFEVSIYNKEVRSQVRENQSHLYFDDQWADVRVRDVVARDEAEARRLIAEHFPPDDGFVITAVILTAA
jgi:hypothetical protein